MYTLNMSGAWLNFIIVIFVQFLIFITYAYYTKKLSQVPQVLIKGILIGLIFGLSFDFVFGKLLGLHSYILGFGMPFLVLNTAVSYGFFSANILLLERIRFPHFYIWTIFIMVIYEITNFFFPVWNWGFTLEPFQFLLVLSFGYILGAIFIIGISNTFKYIKRVF